MIRYINTTIRYTEDRLVTYALPLLGTSFVGILVLAVVVNL